MRLWLFAVGYPFLAQGRGLGLILLVSQHPVRLAQGERNSGGVCPGEQNVNHWATTRRHFSPTCLDSPSGKRRGWWGAVSLPHITKGVPLVEILEEVCPGP